MNKLTPEKAREEITSWLDKKKVYESTREKNEADIDILVEAMTRGDLVLSETFEFTHQLLFPIGEKGSEVTEVKYRSRLNDGMLKTRMAGVKGTDVTGVMQAYAGAITNQPKPILEAMDSADKKIMMSIVTFFF